MSSRRRHLAAWGLALAACAGAVAGRVLSGSSSTEATLASAPQHHARAHVTTVVTTRTVVVTTRERAASAARRPAARHATTTLGEGTAAHRQATQAAAAPVKPAGARRSKPVHRTHASAPAASHPSKPATQNVDGDVVATRYGPVQVRLVLNGSRIADVVVLADPNDLERSRQIDADALPRLRAQVLAAQSAAIDGVAGATYTSQGYKQSVQSALDLA